MARPHAIGEWFAEAKPFTENCQEISPDLKTVCLNSDWTGTIGQPQVLAA